MDVVGANVSNRWVFVKLDRRIWTGKLQASN